MTTTVIEKPPVNQPPQGPGPEAQYRAERTPFKDQSNDVKNTTESQADATEQPSTMEIQLSETLAGFEEQRRQLEQMQAEINERLARIDAAIESLRASKLPEATEPAPMAMPEAGPQSDLVTMPAAAAVGGPETGSAKMDDVDEIKALLADGPGPVPTAAAADTANAETTLLTVEADADEAKSGRTSLREQVARMVAFVRAGGIGQAVARAHARLAARGTVARHQLVEGLRHKEGLSKDEKQRDRRLALGTLGTAAVVLAGVTTLAYLSREGADLSAFDVQALAAGGAAGEVPGRELGEVFGKAPLATEVAPAWSPEALHIDSGEGWLTTFDQMGVTDPTIQERILCDHDTMQQLVDMKVAYVDADGGYGLNMTPDQKLPVEALELIEQAAARAKG